MESHSPAYFSSVKTLDHSVVHKQPFGWKEETLPLLTLFWSRLWAYRRTPNSLPLYWGSQTKASDLDNEQRQLPWAGMWAVLLLSAVRRAKNKRCSLGHPGTQVLHKTLPCTYSGPALPGTLCTTHRRVRCLLQHTSPKRRDWTTLILHPKQLDRVSQNVGTVSRLHPNNWLEVVKAGGEKGGRRDSSGGGKADSLFLSPLAPSQRGDRRDLSFVHWSDSHPVFPLSKIKVECVQMFMSIVQKVTEKAKPSCALWKQDFMQHFCFQGHYKINSSTFSATVCHC